MWNRRRIREYRPLAVLIVLVILSLASLATGYESNWLGRGVRSLVSTTAAPFLRLFSGVADVVTYSSKFVLDYDSARRNADELRRQLAETVPQLARIQELDAENKRLRAMLAFDRASESVELFPVRVRVIGWLDGTLTIDRGEADGVRQFMCAMTPDGVVGVVARVDRHHAFVYTLHHPDCRIGSMVQRTRATGIVHGSGSDFDSICRMEYIALKDEVKPGDIVVTSGGEVFPKGFPIGRVSAVQGEGALHRTAYLDPFADPYRLDEVFLVTRAETQPEDLAGGFTPRLSESDAGGVPMPDERSVQERFAP